MKFSQTAIKVMQLFIRVFIHTFGTMTIGDSSLITRTLFETSTLTKSEIMDMITAETRPIILETVHPEVKMMIEEC
jgi:hypothetical protein